MNAQNQSWAVIPSFDETHLEAICEVLGQTDGGLIGSEIGRYLSECNIPDPLPSYTKRHRLYEALRAKQRKDGCANNVFAFIRKVMNPVLYHANPDFYREEVVKAEVSLVKLTFCGPSDVAKEITIALEAGGRLRLEHPTRGTTKTKTCQSVSSPSSS